MAGDGALDYDIPVPCSTHQHRTAMSAFADLRAAQIADRFKIRVFLARVY